VKRIFEFSQTQLTVVVPHQSGLNN